MEYIVLVYDNFNPETPVAYPFDDLLIARKYLHGLWNSCLNEEISEGGKLDFENTFHEDEFAQIKWQDGEYAFYILSSVTGPIKLGENGAF